MNKSRFTTPQEREAYRIGYERGRRKEMLKAAFILSILTIISCSSKDINHLCNNCNDVKC